MSSAYWGAPTAGGPGVQVLGTHFVATGFGPAVGGAQGAGFLAFTGVGPGTLPLAVAGLASIIGGAAAVIWGRDNKKKGSVKRRARKNDHGLPDLSYLASAPG
jgi:hypothetical protein